MNKIIFVLTTTLFCHLGMVLELNAQKIVVKGKVTAFHKMGLNRAKVFVKNSENKVFTDYFGHYSITCNTNDKLIFEANGFMKENVSLKKFNTYDSVNVNLKFKNSEKNIEVATGYRHIEKDKLTHAIEHFTPEYDFSGYNNILDIIKGRITGVSVGPNSITVRGTDTFGGEEALIVVDGVAVDYSMMKNISPSQVKSVNILKGASASAIYGSRGMGGVIVIKTKTAR